MNPAEIRITAEPIDNERCKFVVSEPVHAGGVRRFASPDEASGSPLAEGIFAIADADVAEVIVSGNLVTVVKRGPAPWQTVGKAVGQVIRAALAGAGPAVAPKPAAPATPGADADAPRLLLLLPTATYRTAAFVEAARRLGVDLTVASERPSTFQDANPRGLLTLDLSDPARAAREARAFAEQHPLHGVVGVDDDTAVVAAAIAATLGLRGNSVAAARVARDKHEQRTLLAAAGVPVPRFTRYGVDDDPRRLAAGVSYPCVLKPLRLAASRGVIRADTPAEFVAAFERVKRILDPVSRSILVEDFVPGREYALEGLLVAGELHMLALFDKPDPLGGPYFEETIYVTPSRLPADGQRAVAACAAR